MCYPIIWQCGGLALLERKLLEKLARNVKRPRVIDKRENTQKRYKKDLLGL